MIIKNLVGVADCFDFRSSITFGGQSGIGNLLEFEHGLIFVGYGFRRRYCYICCKSTFILTPQGGGGVKVLLFTFSLRK